MTSLQIIWGSPPIKKPGYAYGGGKWRVGTKKWGIGEKRLRTPDLNANILER